MDKLLALKVFMATVEAQGFPPQHAGLGWRPRR
jgi:hypothetical protein